MSQLPIPRVLKPLLPERGPLQANRVFRCRAGGLHSFLLAGGANGLGNAATFTNPSGVAVDSTGNIYVAEATSNRVGKITVSGPPNLSTSYTVNAFAGNGTAGHLDGVGAAAEFSHPYGPRMRWQRKDDLGAG